MHVPPSISPGLASDGQPELPRGSLVVVHDTNPEALARRVSAVRSLEPDRRVVGVSSRVATRHHCVLEAPRPTLALIDLCDTDRYTIDRPGERLIRRIASDPELTHVTCVAWSAHAVPDAIAATRAAGASGFVVADVGGRGETVDLRAALSGSPRWPADPGAAPDPDAVDGAWSDRFRARHGAPWEAWMEPVLARLATTETRTATAGMLVATNGARTERQAQTRTRKLARILAGEHAAHPGEVARRASLVLAELAGVRPLAEAPALPVSLAQGAELLRRSPTLAAAAGLTGEEIADILRLDELVAAKREAEDRRDVGAPPADLAQQERRHAAGRLALERGAGAEELDVVANGILRRAESALRELDDCRTEDLFTPEARTAVALSLLEQRTDLRAAAEAINGVEPHGDGLRFDGLGVLDLLGSTALDPARADRFLRDVDARLAGAVDRGR